MKRFPRPGEEDIPEDDPWNPNQDPDDPDYDPWGKDDGGGSKNWPTVPDPEVVPPDPIKPPEPGPGPAAPPPPRLPGPSGGSGGGRVPGTTDYPIAGGKRFFQYPDWVPPDIQFGTWTPPSWDVQPFTHPDFEAPDPRSIETDPEYQQNVSEMDRAVKNLRSSQGLLSTGGTLTDLMKMRSGLAAQQIGNIYNRAQSTYNTNRGNARDIWGTKYQGETDEFNRGLSSFLTQEQSKAGEWDRSRDLYGTNLAKEMGGYGLNLDTSRLNLARDNSGFQNLLGLTQLMLAGRPQYTPSV